MNQPVFSLPQGWRVSDAGMSDLVKAKDWSTTPLGSRHAWSQSLSLAVDLIMASAFPMALRWGPDFILIYNEAYRPILGDKHPWALGRPAREAWAEVWPQLEPAHLAILHGASPSIFSDDVLLRIQRHGDRWDDAHFTLGYSPVPDPTAATGVGGIFVTAVETTDRVEAASALRISEERYEMALGAADTIGSWDWNIVADKVVANAKFAEIFSVDPALAAAGAPIAEFFAGIHPDDLERVSAAIDHAVKTGEDFAAEYRLQGHNGDIRWIAARGRCHYDRNGAPVRFPGAASDVTDRKDAEEALSDSRSYLQDILNSSGEAFYALDRDGVTQLCNKAFVRLMGFAREEDAVGRKLHDVIHHSHPDGAPYAVAECPIYISASTGVPCHVENEVFFRLSGEAFPVEYWVRPIYRDGALEGAICTFIDISERRAAQEALAESEAQFRTLAQAMPNHVWTSAPSGLLDWFNDRAYEYGGVPRGSMDGEGWLAMVHPDDAAVSGGRWATSLATGQDYETEFRLRRADGAWRWHLARAVAIRGADGEIARWIGTNTDIEDQKTTAEALSELNANLAERVAEQAAERDRLWQTSQDLLVVIGDDGAIRAANPAWSTVLGWRPDEVIGRHHLAFSHQDDQSSNNEALESALAGPIPKVESRMLHKDGGHRWVSWVAAPEGDVVYASGRNITAQKEAETELGLAQDALRQSQKMEAVGQLTGGIAHDFNNMLAVVIGSLDLLGRRLGSDERARRYVDAASEGARRAANLTQRLLSFARQQPLEPKPTDLNKLVAGMSDLLSHSIGADVRLETVLAGGLWRAEIDPNQLENVILNLVVNARDAMPDGGRLTIETQNAHLDDRYAATHDGVAPGQYVMLAVSDTGSGMPEDVIAKAFDPFFTTKAVGKGTGLGLSQVYGFIKQSGGHVKIYSEAGHGTTVKIYLARLHGAAADELAAPPSLVAVAGARETILVVEDEPGVRAFTIEALTELGYTVLAAADGAAALRLLDGHPEVDLLFTDVVMPDMNGRKLADEALVRRPGLKVLFTTGYTRNAVVHNGVLDREVALIGKPFTVEALAAKVRKVLG